MKVQLGGPARAFTYGDLEGMAEDGYRREIIGGSLIVTPAPSLGHQWASSVLHSLLFAAATPQVMVLAAPCDWRLPDGGSVQPDLLVISRHDFTPSGHLPPTATPLLVVEILSPSNPDQDRAVKRHLYQSLSVPAYWIVDATTPSITALRIAGDRYVLEGQATGDEELVSDWPFPLRVSPSHLKA